VAGLLPLPPQAAWLRSFSASCGSPARLSVKPQVVVVAIWKLARCEASGRGRRSTSRAV
jgi:hypothetical protein